MSDVQEQQVEVKVRVDPAAAATPTDEVRLSPSPAGEVKLDLGCGQSKQPGFIGVDYAPGPGVDIVMNLFEFPWSRFLTSSVDEIHCSHVAEHVPAAWWGKLPQESFGSPRYGWKIAADSIEDKRGIFCFFDEIWRILKPGGKAKIIVPASDNDRGFQDPTHTIFFVRATFLYLSADWREREKLTHYNVQCQFKQELAEIHNPTTAGKNDETRAWMREHYRNVVTDYVCSLTAVKDDPK